MRLEAGIPLVPAEVEALNMEAQRVGAACIPFFIEVPLISENQDRTSYVSILSLPGVAALPRDENNSYSAARCGLAISAVYCRRVFPTRRLVARGQNCRTREHRGGQCGVQHLS